MGDVSEEVIAVLWSSESMRVVRVHGDLGIWAERQILADGVWRLPTVDEGEALDFNGEHTIALMDAAEELYAARAEATREERARIVAMVRADAALWPDDSKTNGAMLYLADRIERGET